MQNVYFQFSFFFHVPLPIFATGLLVGAGLSYVLGDTIRRHAKLVRHYNVASQALATTACVLWIVMSQNKGDISYAIAVDWLWSGACVILAHSTMVAVVVRRTYPQTILQGRYSLALSLLLTACLWAPILMPEVVCPSGF